MKTNSSFGSVYSLCSTLFGLAVTLGLLAPAVLPTGASAFPPLDHFQGYQILQGSPPPGVIVDLLDQFGSQQTDLGPPIRFLVPVSKNDEPIDDPWSHLTCYQIPDGNPAPPVIATNQFGPQPLTLDVPESLCVPTEKLIDPGPVNLDHYKCYEASGNPVGIPVTLADQFDQPRTTLVLDPKLFCAPAEKNGEPMLDPIEHLTCYETELGPPPPMGPIPILNQFLPVEEYLYLLETDTLCVPSTKELVPSLDHFLVYQASGPPGVPVSIADQFQTEPQLTDLGLVNLFLVPANKNDEGIVDEFSHLTCYEILGGEPGPVGVTVTNQFVTDAPLGVDLARELCLPTMKLEHPGPVDIDHFKCYEAFGAPIDAPVTLVDQFQLQGLQAQVLEPFRLCNPAEKNGEPILNPDDHLVCYLLSDIGMPVGPIPIQNQFWSTEIIDVLDPFALCVRSAKTVPEPFFVLGLGSGILLLGALDRRRRKRAARTAAAN